MSTQTTQKNKLKILLHDGRDLYHTQDLAVLWGIDNPNTLYTTIKRYIQRGVLQRIYKGFYAAKPIDQIDPVRLGLAALHSYGYLSTESILAREGIIFQDVKYITLVSSVSRKFELAGHKYLIRRLKPRFSHNTAGVMEKGRIREATVERAVADLLYFNPDYHLDAERGIDWRGVEKIKKQVGY